MLKFLLKSGKKLEIDIAPIETGLALYRAILIECKGAGLDLNFADEDTILSILLKNKEACLNILSSENVLEAVKDCCAKVVYDKQRFTMDVFNKIENRKDFFPTMMLVAIENIRPFFEEPHIILDSIQSQFLN
ncbi:MAG: hypothetical protein IIW86_01940 [Clostridia bacterium]|nr:hypothetical protein [Clostridia bacterium]